MGSHAGSLIGNEIYVLMLEAVDWRVKGNTLLHIFFLENRLLSVYENRMIHT